MYHPCQMNSFRFFANVMSIKGFLRTCIMDLQRERYHLLSNEYSKFSKKKVFTENEIDSEVFDFMINEELIHESSIFDKYLTDFCDEYSSASIISNAIIEIDKVNFITKHLIDQFNLIGIESVQIVVSEINTSIDIEELIVPFNNSRIKSIEFIIQRLSAEMQPEELIKAQSEYPRLKLISVQNSLNYKRIFELNKLNIIFDKNNYSLDYNFISTNTFFCNNDLYVEAKNHNPYLNKKIFIDKFGYIKNAPESNTSFGSLSIATNLKSITNASDFQQNWAITKDKIDICKDCEFRYMCLDNRIPINRKLDEWFHISDCNYNPYIAKWHDEDGYKTFSECGVVSNTEGFKINRKKI